MGLRNLKLLKHLNALREQGLPTSSWDILILFLMCENLDKHTEQSWEECNKGNLFIALENFKTFLQSKADTMKNTEKRNKLNNFKGYKKGNESL